MDLNPWMSAFNYWFYGINLPKLWIKTQYRYVQDSNPQEVVQKEEKNNPY